MKKKDHIIFIVIFVVMGVSVACGLPIQRQPEVTTPPKELNTQPLPLDTATATDEVSEPILSTATFTVAPTEIPNNVINSGQISYLHDEQIWRYLVDTDEMFQVSSGEIGDENGLFYHRARFSPDGRYLGYNLGEGSWIQDFESNDRMDITPYGQFFAWHNEGTHFYAIQGEMTCPPLENLEDQALLNFDILRLDLNDLTNPTMIANIGGGLRFVETISPDGAWASINFCACYSECGPFGLVSLPTLSGVAPPAGIDVGSLDFSSDSQRVAILPWQMFGYVEGALSVANTDYSELVEVFSAPNTAPLTARWSPNADWIAFTTVSFEDDGFSEIDRCVRLARPDGNQESVVACSFADLITWSPDGTQLLFSQKNGDQENFYIYDLNTGTSTPIPITVDPYSRGYMDWGRLP